MRLCASRKASNDGRQGAGRSRRIERSVTRIAPAVVLAIASSAASAGEPTEAASIGRADAHGIRHRPAEATVVRGMPPTGRAALTSSPAVPGWEFLGVWGGEADVVAASPANPNVVLAGIGPGYLMLGGLYRSTDRGATWHRVGMPTMGRVPVDAIAFAPDGTAYVGTPWQLWKSTDHGDSWVQHVLPSTSDWVRSVVVDPSDPSTVWAGVGSQVFVSPDGGQSWIDRTPAQASRTCSAIAVDPTRSERVFAGCSDVYGSTSRLFVSDDGGSSWDDRSAGLPDNPISDIAHDGNRVLVAGGLAYNDQPLGLFASSDAGLSWTALHDGSWPVLYVSDVEVDPGDPSSILLATDDGVFRSDDAGASWQFGVGGTAGLTIRSVRLSPDGSGAAFAGEETHGVLISNGNGTAFEIASTGINELDVNSSAINPLDPLEIAIAYHGLNSGGVYSTRDGGATWLDEDCPPTRYVRAVYSPTGVLHAISSGPTTVAAEGVYRRDPDGTWVHLGPDQGPLFDTDLISLRFSAHDPELVFAAGKDGYSSQYEAAIWGSDDAGASWTRLYESAHGYRVVYDIEIVEDGTDSELLAVWIALDAVSGGTLRSVDGGQTWVDSLQGPPPDVVPVALSPSPRGPEVFFLVDYGFTGGLYVTEDGGETWTSTGFSGTRVWDAVCHPTRAGRVYVATDQEPFVLMSDDGGVHFTALDEGLAAAGYPMELDISADQTPRLLLSTTDGSFSRLLANPPPRRSGGRVAP